MEPAVVWSNPEGSLSVDHPIVAVWTFEQLPDELGNLWQGPTMDETTEIRIVEELTALCEQCRKENTALD